MLNVVESMLAVLVVVDVLQAVKRKVVTPEELQTSIERHLVLYVAAYGPEAVRPKHHYVRHLPAALARTGTLISTLTHERKHRVVKRYTRGRVNLQSWAMEDITSQQLFDISQAFLAKQVCSRPRLRTLHVLRELYPAAGDEDFTMHAAVAVQNGSARVGDIIYLTLNGSRQVAELLLTFSVRRPEGNVTLSIVSKWEPQPGAEHPLANYLLTNGCIMVPTLALECALTHRLSDRRQSCAVVVPWEYRLAE
jgi:hypothetical protein